MNRDIVELLIGALLGLLVISLYEFKWLVQKYRYWLRRCMYCGVKLVSSEEWEHLRGDICKKCQDNFVKNILDRLAEHDRARPSDQGGA